MAIQGNEKRKRVVICQQLFPVSSRRVRRGASENFPTKNERMRTMRSPLMQDAKVIYTKFFSS